MSNTITEPQVSAREWNLMMSATGLDKGGANFRNHLVLPKDSFDFPLCESLVNKGLMACIHRAPSNTFLFWVTMEGFKFLPRR